MMLPDQPQWQSWRITLDFILDHPRRVYTIFSLLGTLGIYLVQSSFSTALTGRGLSSFHWKQRDRDPPNGVSNIGWIVPGSRYVQLAINRRELAN